MAARPMPTSGVPKQQDVNAASSTVVTEPAYEPAESVEVPETQNHDGDVELTETDMQELEQKPIPYKRFREVNEKAKVLEREKESIAQKYEDELRSLTRQYEAKLSTKQEPEPSFSYEYDTSEDNRQVHELTKTIENLSTQLNQMKVDQTKQTRTMEIEKLKNDYPKADPLAVKGWAMAYPEASLEELMAKSHDTNVSLIQTSINDLISKKKERANKSKIPTGAGSIKLTPEERPKTLKDATRMARQWLNSY
jgi:hypothetical protein